MNIKYISKRIINRIKWEHYKYLVDHYPRKVLDKIWMRQYGYTVDWNNPCDLNEKIEWLICYGDTSLWPILADKYRVRDYVTQKGLGHILPKLYGVWDDANKIDFSLMPDKFVLKCNHDCGSYHIVNKQNRYDKKQIIEDLNRHLKIQFGYKFCEPHYNKIKPLIIAEEFLDSSDNTFSSSLIDYKVWCFNGKPYSIWACYNRDHHGTDVNSYDLFWHVHPEHSIFTSYYRNGEGRVPKPQKLDEMLNVASILTKGQPQARVDFYIVDEKLYLGEITLTSMAGRMNFYTKEYLIELGNQVIIR